MTIAFQTMAMPPRTVSAAFGAKRGSKYNLAALEAGTDQCIVLDGMDSKKDHSKLSSAVANYKKSGGTGKFSIRTVKVTEDGVEKTKVGLWKIAD
jgi:predicted aspartyl protease